MITYKNQNEKTGLSVDIRGNDMDQIPFQNRNNSSSLVGAEALLQELFPDKKSRPTLRWLRGLQAKRLVPFRKIGRRVYFDPKEVRRTFDAQFKVEPL